jgi:membrane-bound ClpP family serine protease
MIDPQLKVYRYVQPSTGLTAYFCEEELAQQHDPASWRQQEMVTSANGPLQLSGRRAAEMGVAWKLVDNFEEFKQAYGLEKNPAMVEPGWVDYLVDALTTDGARMFLLVMGFVGLYLEIHSPGIGAGAFISLVAFLLYFWAQHLKGTAQVLEVLLFLAGMFCLALEIFVIPGFAIFGLGGGLMIIASLVLASQTFVIPANEYQLEQLRDSFLVLGGAMVSCIVAAAVMRRFLPSAPVFNRMMLQPPTSEEVQAISHRESLANYSHLLDQQGIATTPLMLSGKARFGDELVDVVSAGEAIDRGTPVIVVEVSGNRVVVRSVQEG